LLELRYFGGLTAEESAGLMGVSIHKINRQIRLAQAWLRRELEAPGDHSPENASESA
jgi:DNA-directed RNA polymerase specialized sigma24 family protein